MLRWSLHYQIRSAGQARARSSGLRSRRGRRHSPELAHVLGQWVGVAPSAAELAPQLWWRCLVFRSTGFYATSEKALKISVETTDYRYPESRARSALERSCTGYRFWPARGAAPRSSCRKACRKVRLLADAEVVHQTNSVMVAAARLAGVTPSTGGSGRYSVCDRRRAPLEARELRAVVLRCAAGHRRQRCRLRNHGPIKRKRRRR